MQFLNRIEELQRLHDALNKDIANFVVIYGRRRCGKSRLIRQILTNKDICFMADKSESAQQRYLFSREVSKIIQGFDKVIYPDWTVLLETLNDRIQKKTTVCLDEFPYLVKSTPELPSIIQRLIDHKEKLSFNLILCGSSQQMMHSLVFDSSEPLYGRADEIIKIKPLKLKYIKDALRCSFEEAVEEYSVWGGVPRYWELRQSQPDLFSAIKYHVFSTQGVLYDEPNRLFVDDMRDTVHSFTILSLIAAGCNRLSEIAARLEKPATNLSNPLDKLIKLGYIERETPFGENTKNGKKSLYKISDPFLRFYFKFVVPNRSSIEFEKIDMVLQNVRKDFNNYVSEQWEKLCRDYVQTNKIANIQFENPARWWGNISKNEMFEFDIVAISPDKKNLLVGECKWSDKVLNEKKLLEEITQKAEKVPSFQNKTVVPVLFLKQNKHKSKNILLPKDIIQ